MISVKNCYNISIIIPVFNVATYLDSCIQSIIKSNIYNVEVILIDDGSTDGSSELCDELAGTYSLCKVIHQQNSGVSAARNAGLEIALGEWVWFVDADDMIQCNKELFRIMDDTTDLIMFGYQEMLDNKIIQTLQYENSCGISKETFLKNHLSYFVWNMVFRRDIIEKYHLRFTKGIKMGEDLEFQYKYMIHCQNPVSISAPLYIYRKREGSAMNNVDSRTFAVVDALMILRNMLSYIQEYKVVEEEWLSIRLEGIMKSLLYSAYHTNNKINQHKLQKDVRDIMRGFREIGYHTFDSMKMRLAYTNIFLYYMLNKIYLKIKGYD